MQKLLFRASKALIVALLLAIGSTTTSIASAPTALAQQNATSTVLTLVTPDPILSNCYAYVRSQIPSLPLASDIVSNTTPHVGSVAIFQYGDLPHYAIITKLDDSGFWVTDSNFGGPGIRTHYIHWDDAHIKGFWGPSDTS